MESAFPLEWGLDTLSANSIVSDSQSATTSHPQLDEPTPPAQTGEILPVAEEAPENPQTDGNEVQANQHRPKRKRASSKGTVGSVPQAESNAVAGETSKKRGRPRTNAVDETAAERRRTQIRLAQRAYRMRKETVISSLSERVAQLESTVDEMSRTFLAFNDDVIKTGIVAAQPGLAELLGRTTRRFLELASKISPDSDEESQSEAAHLDTLATGDRSSLRDYASLGSGMVDHHTVTTPNGLNASSPGQSSCARPVHLQAATKSPKTMDFDLEKHFSVSSRNPSVENVRSGFTSFPLIQEPSTQGQGTYSFQETTFSRRLHRRCLELGYTFLNDHSLTTHHISSKFRFTFGFLTRERLARVFYTLLQSKAGEPLEYWHKPFFYVGRAGMHYPRRDESGYEIFPPNMHPPERAFGPFPFHAAENPHPYKNVNEMIEAIGYGGDWFDCHDVEGYLLEKGIRLYSRSSYVLVSRSALSRSVHAGQVPNLATYSTTGSHPGSHGSTASVTPSPQNTHFDSPSLMAQLPSDTYYPPQDDFGPEMSRLQGLDQNPSLSLGSGPALPNMASPWHPQQPTVESLPHLTLDVDKFVVELCQRATCLGRAPGFRKHDVDAALALSVME